MRGRDPGGKIGEEVRDLDREVEPRAGRRDPGLVLAARLHGEADPPPLFGREERERLGDDVGHDARALRAAGDQHAQARGEARIGRLGRGDHGRADRVAGVANLRPRRRVRPLELGEAAGDDGDPRAQEPVGAPEHSVLLVQHARESE